MTLRVFCDTCQVPGQRPSRKGEKEAKRERVSDRAREIDRWIDRDKGGESEGERGSISKEVIQNLTCRSVDHAYRNSLLGLRRF